MPMKMYTIECNVCRKKHEVDGGHLEGYNIVDWGKYEKPSWYVYDGTNR